jgi:hypothetical protein
LRSFIDKYNPEQAYIINLDLSKTIKINKTALFFMPFHELRRQDLIPKASRRQGQVAQREPRFKRLHQTFSLGDLTVVVDQSDFNGRAKVEAHKRPKITLALESSLLDMTALLKNLKEDEKEPGPASGALESRLFSKNPLPLDVLKQVNADIRLNAKNVRARDANFEFGRLVLTLENGDLNVDTLQATYELGV